MIKHIVMWKVRGDSPAERQAAAHLVKRSFEGLAGRIPGMISLEVGLDSSGVDYACDMVLYTEFETQEALDAYAAHPEHLRVRQELGDVRVARYQVDYPCDTSGHAGSGAH
jgi:heme-degrading monooxygenase HmoA